MFDSAQLSTYQLEKYCHLVAQYWVVAISRGTAFLAGGGGPPVGTSIDLLGEE